MMAAIMSSVTNSPCPNSNLGRPVSDRFASEINEQVNDTTPEHLSQALHNGMSPSWSSSTESTAPNQLEALFVGDLSYFCSDADLQNVFQPYGPVHKSVVRKSKTNEPLHYGFVEIPTSNVDRAIQELNGAMLLGRKLR